MVTTHAGVSCVCMIYSLGFIISLFGCLVDNRSGSVAMEPGLASLLIYRPSILSILPQDGYRHSAVVIDR